jgi:hypothetical protein
MVSVRPAFQFAPLSEDENTPSPVPAKILFPFIAKDVIFENVGLLLTNFQLC